MSEGSGALVMLGIFPPIMISLSVEVHSLILALILLRKVRCSCPNCVSTFFLSV